MTWVRSGGRKQHVRDAAIAAATPFLMSLSSWRRTCAQDRLTLPVSSTAIQRGAFDLSARWPMGIAVASQRKRA